MGLPALSEHPIQCRQADILHYSGNIEKKLDLIKRCTWGRSRTSMSFTAFDHPGQHSAIEHSFYKDPIICPECSSLMILDTVFSFFADMEIKNLVKSHAIFKGVEALLHIVCGFDISSSLSVILYPI